jgi:hypothetical protein
VIELAIHGGQRTRHVWRRWRCLQQEIAQRCEGVAKLVSQSG